MNWYLLAINVTEWIYQTGSAVYILYSSPGVPEEFSVIVKKMRCKNNEFSILFSRWKNQWLNWFGYGYKPILSRFG